MKVIVLWLRGLSKRQSAAVLQHLAISWVAAPRAQLMETSDRVLHFGSWHNREIGSSDHRVIGRKNERLLRGKAHTDPKQLGEQLVESFSAFSPLGFWVKKKEHGGHGKQKGEGHAGNAEYRDSVAKKSWAALPRVPQTVLSTVSTAIIHHAGMHPRLERV
jgi:hypothetical protein